MTRVKCNVCGQLMITTKRSLVALCIDCIHAKRDAVADIGIRGSEVEALLNEEYAIGLGA